MKTAIVDFREGHLAALRDDGCVIKIQNAGYTLGQVIELHEPVRSRWRRTVLSLAAAAALLLSIGSAAYATPYGVVTLDADSSKPYFATPFSSLGSPADSSKGLPLLFGRLQQKFTCYLHFLRTIMLFCICKNILQSQKT